MPSCATPWLALAAVAMLLAGNVSPAAAQRQECLNANLNDGQGTYAKPPWVEKRSGNICVATCSICEATSSPYKISAWGESGSKLAAAGKHHCNLRIGNYAATGVTGVTPHASYDNHYREFNTYALGARREWYCGAVKCRCTGCLPGYVLADDKKSCTACPANHYRSASDKHTDSCKRHSDCGGATPYVKQHGTASSNTVCRAATVSCSADQFPTQYGTSCGQCKNKQCPPSTYRVTGSACTWQTKGYKCAPQPTCAPGLYLYLTDTNTKGSCKRCEYKDTCSANEFRTGSCSGTRNGYRCNPLKDCAQGREFVWRAHSTVADRVCGACPAGTLSLAANSPRCQAYTDCPRGTHVADEPTDVADRKCTRCPAGFESNTTNSAACTPGADFNIRKMMGSWVHIGSSVKMSITRTVTTTITNTKELSRSVTEALTHDEESASSRTFGMTLGSHTTLTDANGKATSRERCAGQEHSTTDTQAGELTITAGVEAKGAVVSASLEVEASVRSEVERTGQTSRNDCDNSEGTTSRDETSGAEKQQQNEDTQSIMASVQEQFSSELGKTLSTMTETSTEVSTEVESECGGVGMENTWQWVVEGTTESGKTIKFPTNHQRCVGHANFMPKCPPEQCGNAACTCCMSATLGLGSGLAWFEGIDVCQCVDDKSDDIRHMTARATQPVVDCRDAAARGLCYAETVPEDFLTQYDDVSLAGSMQSFCPCNCASKPPPPTAAPPSATTAPPTPAKMEATTVALSATTRGLPQPPAPRRTTTTTAAAATTTAPATGGADAERGATTAPSRNDAASEASEASPSNMGAIIGGVAAGLAVIIIGVLALVAARRRETPSADRADANRCPKQSGQTVVQLEGVQVDAVGSHGHGIDNDVCDASSAAATDIAI